MQVQSAPAKPTPGLPPRNQMLATIKPFSQSRYTDRFTGIGAGTELRMLDAQTGMEALLEARELVRASRVPLIVLDFARTGLKQARFAVTEARHLTHIIQGYGGYIKERALKPSDMANVRRLFELRSTWNEKPIAQPIGLIDFKLRMHEIVPR